MARLSLLRRTLALAATGAVVAALSFGVVQAATPVQDLRSATDAALAAERAAVDQSITDLNAQVAALQGQVAERDALVVTLLARIAELEAQLDPCAVHVPAGTNLAAAVKAAPVGAVVCLSGSYITSVPVEPLAGQTIQGPATVIGTGLDVFNLKDALGVTLIDLDISGADRHGVACGVGTTVIGGRLHHNDKDGVGCDLDGLGPVLVDGVEIDHNGSDAWLGKGAAGIKWFHAHGVTVTNSFVHDNYGNGVWCDAQCGDFTVTNNIITCNLRKGVFYEKGGESDGSFGGAVYVGFMTVTGNTIQDNNTERSYQGSAGVSILASKNALVADNIFGGNMRAIIVRDDPSRVADDKHGWLVSNVTLRNNVLNGDEVVGCALAGVTCS